MRTPLKISTSVFRGSRWRDHCFQAPFSWVLLNADLSWRPEDHFCKLFVIEMSPERHEKSERRPPVSWRPCAGVQPRSSVHLVTYHACLSAIRDNLLLCLWPSKRKPRHCGESTGKSDQDSVTKYHHWKKVQDKGLGAPCREKPLEKSGLSNLRHQIA